MSFDRKAVDIGLERESAIVACISDARKEDDDRSGGARDGVLIVVDIERFRIVVGGDGKCMSESGGIDGSALPTAGASGL